VLASLVFWLSIKLSSTYSTLERIDIQYVLPQGLTFAQQPPEAVQATVRANGWELIRQSFREDERSILIDSVDLRNNPDGIISIRSAVAESFRDAGLSVDALTNERVVLRTEAVSTKRIPLQLVSSFTFAPGFNSVQPPLLTPDSVTISGPGSILDSLSFWVTDTLTADELRDSVELTALTARPQTRNLRVEPQLVEVALFAEQFTEKRLYVPVRATGIGSADSVTIFPRQLLVSVAVGLSEYDKVMPSDFSLVVDLSTAISSQTTEVPVIVKERPSEGLLIGIQPRRVEAFVRRNN